MPPLDTGRPLVSVVVPCYNAALWIRETLDTAYAQRVDGLEVVVVDDGSTDESARIVEAEYPSATLIRTRNQGASRARNAALEIAGGRFVQFLDADDPLPASKLQVQIDALERTGADVAYCDWQHLLRRGDGTFRPEPVVAREIHGATDVALFTDCWYPIHAYLFRREIVDRVGGFNPALPVIQDARFALDCALRGARFVYCPGIVAQYRMHSSLQNSKRDPDLFNRDIFHNTLEVEAWWRAHGGLTEEREAALLLAYQYITRSTYRRDRVMFESALKALENIRPRFRPTRPRALGWLSRLVGYRNAEEVAYRYRRVKRLVASRGPTA
jgi:glycosyltransferase involved in cell wall biosynthesis